MTRYGRRLRPPAAVLEQLETRSSLKRMSLVRVDVSNGISGTCQGAIQQLTQNLCCGNH